MRFGEVPSPDQKPSEGNLEDKLIMHVALPLSNGSMLLGSDRPAVMGKGNFGNNFSISIDTASRDEADKLFKGLSAGGTVTMPMENTFWGSYFGMFTDKFGVQWMVSFNTTPQK